MELTALSVGHALDTGSVSSGLVHSVFARAVNLEIHGEMWTVLAAERSDLPLGIRLAAQDFTTLGVRRGDRVHVRAGFAAIASKRGRLVVDCRAAPRWIPAKPEKLAPGLAARLFAAAALVKGRSWHGAASMASAVVSALPDARRLPEVLVQVVGCGSGSTPAGDDVLIGILAVLKSPLSGAAGAEAAAALRRALLPLLPTTTDISGHLLRQAARGLFARNVHELIGALLGDPTPSQLNDRVARVIDTGASSGADLCTGLLACARAWLVPQQQTAAA